MKLSKPFLIGIILLCIIIIFLIVVFHKIIVEGFESSIPDCEIIISRYNESLDWITSEPFNQYNLIIYNKGQNSNFNKPDNVKKIVDLPNVGKCDHTYLYHIVENYDNLADITIFLPGSCEMDYKNTKAKKLLNIIQEHNNAVFLYDTISPNIKNDFYDFSLNDWITSNTTNKQINPESSLELSKIRPFGKWYEDIFGEITIQYMTYFGIFSVSKKDILQHPKEYYENLISQLNRSSNPEVGHYFERAWVAVFYPMNSTIFISSS